MCVIDAGQIPTPVAYFAKKAARADALLMITASHNPPSDNGLKIMIGQLPPTENDLRAIRSSSEAGDFRRAKGVIESFDPAPGYRKWVESRWRGTPNTRVVLDTGNGAWSHLAPEIFRNLGFDPYCINCEPDGNFPGRPPDCARTANLTTLRAAVLESGGDLGIVWDGDGDRVAFVDHTGRHASADEISILFARHLLRDAPAGEIVVCDIKLSGAVRRTVIECGAIPVFERSGHAFMRSRMRAERALLGLDACGHYFFRELDFGDDGLIAALNMIAMVQGSLPLAALRESVCPMFSTPELRVPAALMDYREIVSRLREEFPGAMETNVDGVRLELEEGVLLVRKSSTEPMVSLRIEGYSQAGYGRLLERCLRSLDSTAPLMRLQIEEAAR
jgi:phosphomannomutase